MGEREGGKQEGTLSPRGSLHGSSTGGFETMGSEIFVQHCLVFVIEGFFLVFWFFPGNCCIAEY